MIPNIETNVTLFQDPSLLSESEQQNLEQKILKAESLSKRPLSSHQNRVTSQCQNYVKSPRPTLPMQTAPDKSTDVSLNPTLAQPEWNSTLKASPCVKQISNPTKQDMLSSDASSHSTQRNNASHLSSLPQKTQNAAPLPLSSWANGTSGLNPNTHHQNQNRQGYFTSNKQ